MRVELQDVRKSHILPNGGFVTVLDGIDLILESGSSTILRGPSGSGKTTLLNVMGGLSLPTSGSVRLDGKAPQGCGDHRGTIAHVFQEPFFIPELTVMENLLLPVVRCSKQSTVGRGELLLELFGLSEMFDLFPSALSGGEKRRLNLARAVLPSPSLLLLDEPTACLDEAWGEKTMELVLRQVRDTRATLVIAAADTVPSGDGFRQMLMRKGKVVKDGNSDY